MAYTRRSEIANQEGLIPLGRQNTILSMMSTTPANSNVEHTAEVTLEERAKQEARTRFGQQQHQRFLKNLASIPNLDLKREGKIVACIICSLMKTWNEFEKNGCDNCESFLKVAGQRGSPYLYTSANYQGLIGLIDPKDSWVGKYQHLGKMKAGLYAVSVRGSLSSDIREALILANKEYFNRDKSLARDEAKRRDLELQMENDVALKNRAVRKIGRGQRRANKSVKKIQKEKKKAAAAIVASASTSVDDNEDEEDASFEEPPSPAVPSLTIIHGEIEGNVEFSESESF